MKLNGLLLNIIHYLAAIHFTRLMLNHAVSCLFTRDVSVPSGTLPTNCELSFSFVICANCRLQ